MKLLIVDDHAGMRELIRYMLSPLASQIEECASGEAAVQLCAAYRPHCITMDWRMSAMDGLTAIERIRALDARVHVVVVTQFDRPALRAHATRAGANHFVLKDDLFELSRHLQQVRAMLLSTGA
jgi:CheY-like chemotaxis protein